MSLTKKQMVNLMWSICDTYAKDETEFETMMYAHMGQYDKSGEHYFHHPLSVARNFMSDTKEYKVALLHDVLEDTEVSEEDLELLMVNEEVIEAVKCITHLPHESLEEYLRRVKGNPIALKVKLADIADNMREDRLQKLPKETQERLREKYKKSLEILEEYK